MKKTIVTTSIISIIVGILLAVIGYFVYIVISMRAQVNQNSIAITQIVDFINKNIQAQNPGAVQATETPAKAE
jgi:hypothetical protein